MTKRRTRLGWLGPVIVLVGIAAAVGATLYMVTVRPRAGAIVDTVAISAGEALVVRAEADGGRNFVELRRGDKVVWQALVPPYAGRPGAPGLAWNQVAVSVRVIRDGRAEIFAIGIQDAKKLGRIGLAPDHGKVIKATTGPVTLTDHVRSYEIVSGDGWSQLVALDLTSGQAAWRHELGPVAVEAGGVADGAVWIRQNGIRKAFRATDGREITAASSL
jgi:outer membrane protein assembly factor BamB